MVTWHLVTVDESLAVRGTGNTLARMCHHLRQDAQGWADHNCRGKWVFEMRTVMVEDDGAESWRYRLRPHVVFEDQNDAALFKLFWC